MRSILPFVVILPLLAMGPVQAAPLPTGTDLEADGWQVVRFPGIAPSEFIGKGTDGVELIAKDSSALLLRPIEEDGSPVARLRWRWRVDTVAHESDLATKGADDRPLALHVWFPPSEEGRGIWDRFVDGVKTKILGVELSGRVLTYVWGGRQARGSKFVNPHTGPDGMMIILRGGASETGIWFEEEVDIAADYAMAFGGPAPRPSYIALSADSDDLGGRSAGRIQGIMFSEQ